MGTSNWQNIPFCVEALMKIQPMRVLDIGVGFGRWGMIVREFCDVWYQRVFKEQWAVEIEGIEAFPKNISDYHHQIYNRIHVGDAAVLAEQLPGPWDVVIFGDVLEHFTREAGQRLLEVSLAKSGYVLVNVPLGPDYPQDELYGNSFEQHLSSWEIEDFQRLPLVRHALFHDYSGRPFGSFCLSREDPRDLKSALFSESSEPYEQMVTAGTDRELKSILQRASDLAHELDYIKNSSGFQRFIRMRSSGLWNAARWLRNRNAAVVTVRALGKRSGPSQGSEVWLLQARPNAEQGPVPWEFLERDGSWNERPSADCPYGKCLVSSGGRLRVPVDKDPELRFLMHPWSGQVEVAFQGRRQVIELYAKQARELRVYPRRAAMVLPGRAAAASGNGNGQAPVQSSTDAAFLEKVKREAAEVIAIHCPRWLGISTSTQALFKHTYAVPARADADPYNVSDATITHHAEILAASGVEHFVVSGGDDCHLRLIEKLREIGPGIRVDLLWHGSYAHFQEDYAWQMLKHWIAAAREGTIHRIGVVKKGMEEFLRSEGIRAVFVANHLSCPPEPPATIQAEGKHLGLWLSGVNRWKVPYPMLAAVKMVSHARLHAAGLDERCKDVISSFRIPVEFFEPRPLPHDELLNAIRRTHLSLYVTFSECCPMLPLESFRVGVPCLVGPNSHLFEESLYLFQRLVVPYPDRADVIARYIDRALDERELIMTEYGRYIVEYNAAARQTVEDFLK